MLNFANDVKLIGRVVLRGRCRATKNGFDKIKVAGQRSGK